MMAEDSCATCRFRSALDPDEDGYFADRGFDVRDVGTSICRRYPPRGFRPDWDALEEGASILDAADAALAALWPVVFDEDWCGEFQPSVREYLGV